MQFINAAMLLGLLAVAIPVIIHLLNRKNLHKVLWGAMRFLLDSVRRRRRRVLLEEGRKNERAEILAKLSKGMRLKGTVRNVVDFGAFVDIGVKQDGLLHRTQIPRGETLAVGQVIEVQIIKVEAERGRISLGWG